MAKRLRMADNYTILTLHKAGQSNREIAALLGVNRETIGKHLARAKAQNRPNAPTGIAASSSGPASECKPFREQILAKIELGLEAVRIHHDLLRDHGEQAPSYYVLERPSLCVTVRHWKTKRTQ